MFVRVYNIRIKRKSLRVQIIVISAAQVKDGVSSSHRNPADQITGVPKSPKVAKSQELGAKSKVPGAESREPGAKRQEPGTQSQEPGAKSRVPRAECQEPSRAKSQQREVL